MQTPYWLIFSLLWLLAIGWQTAVHSAELEAQVRVQNPDNHHGVRVTATISGQQTIEYLIDAKTGQSLALDILSNNARAAYRITAPAAPRALHKGHGQQSSYSVTLPRDGTYRVLIYLQDSAASAGESAEFALSFQLRNPG
ncbi:hypothetical protein PVT68_00145 [Microbulbifer bruguierae]|uniref:DNA breaking-rejoining protein n=1 Tax=Microbulbifer bruguierae TaxID=3029061 RepID=A0ABY8NCT8_9GAMM|nr:hypothetical protein [Microbulbifer bruguierae]WGL16731.1 hypothetical protein PVT68_00145 [Microbulbifer bruguierae]